MKFKLECDIDGYIAKIEYDIDKGVLTTTDYDGLINQEKFNVKNTGKMASIFMQTLVDKYCVK